MNQRNKGAAAAAALAACVCAAGCYSPRWAQSPGETPGRAPTDIAELFAKAGGTLTLEMTDPGRDYGYDPGEKDEQFAGDAEELRFRRLEMKLRDRMPQGKVLTDLAFVDGRGNRVLVEAVDLMRLVPRLDTEGDLQYAELLMEEYTRYGVSFRREHGEFDVQLAPGSSPQAAAAAERAYRLELVNNCLDPGKWEVGITTEDYSDFGERLRSPLNLNQNRLLAHSWFYLDGALYDALLRRKNPRLAIDPALARDFRKLSGHAEQVRVDLDGVRKLAGREPVKILEVAHASGREFAPIDPEQHYKWDIGLFLEKASFRTYSDMLAKPVRLGQFHDRGYYDPSQPKVFDYSWVRGLDDVVVERLDVGGAGTFVQLTVRGDGSPYAFVLGNLDLTALDEQRLYSAAFGFNPYPRSRRHDPPQSTIQYDPDQMPGDRRPYSLMVDPATGRWVNNWDKGFDRIYVGWDSLDRDVLEIYLISYERIAPVWMARVELGDELVDRTRVRRSIY